MFPSFFYGQIPKIKCKLFSYYIRLCREEGILPRMDALSQLVSQYSFGAIVMLVVTLAVAFKFLSELLEYFYNKLKNELKNDKSAARKERRRRKAGL